MKALAEILAVCVLGSLAWTTTGRAATGTVTDPRKCATSTPAYCASHAAARVAIAKVKATRRTTGFVQAHCDGRGSLLRWRCRLNDSGAHGWNVTVTYRATSSGWHVYASIAATP